MRLFMTDGLFGRCLEQIGPQFEKFTDVLEELDNWKSNSISRKSYKVEPYNTLHFNDNTNEVAIDFGDYKYFMLVTGFKPIDFEKNKRTVCRKKGKR